MAELERIGADEWQSAVTNSGLKRLRSPGTAIYNQRLINLGLCVACRMPSSAVRCAVCLKENSLRSVARRSKRSSLGTCLDCGDVGAIIAGYCLFHYQKRRDSWLKYYLKHLEQKREYWRDYFVRNHDQIQARRTARVRDGLCYNCRASRCSGSVRFCTKHLAIHRDWTRRYRERRKAEREAQGS